MRKDQNFETKECSNKIKEILEKNKVGESCSSSKNTKDDFESKIPELSKEKDSKLKKECEDLKKRLLLSLADKENLKKTMKREIEKVRDYAISKFAEQIVNSLDSLEKTIESIKENQQQDPTMEGIVEGVVLTAKNIEGVLKDNGIIKIIPLHEKFNHDLHQAVQTVKNKSDEKGKIISVLQCGYLFRDRVLRPAMVIVSE